jgi:hypothetical protein
VEQLQQPENDGQEHCRRFRIENGDSPGEKDEMFGSPSTPVLENPEYQTRWYFKYFLGKLHQNYVGLDNDKIPFFSKHSVKRRQQLVRPPLPSHFI